VEVVMVVVAVNGTAMTEVMTGVMTGVMTDAAVPPLQKDLK